MYFRGNLICSKNLIFGRFWWNASVMQCCSVLLVWTQDLAETVQTLLHTCISAVVVWSFHFRQSKPQGTRQSRNAKDFIGNKSSVKFKPYSIWKHDLLLTRFGFLTTFRWFLGQTRENTGSLVKSAQNRKPQQFPIMLPTSLTCSVQRGQMCTVQALCNLWARSSLTRLCKAKREDFPVQGRKVYWYKYEKDCMLKPRYTARTRHGTFKVCVWKKTHVLSVLLLIWLAASKLENTGSGALYSTDDRALQWTATL